VGEQFVNLVNGMRGETFEDIPEVSERVDLVKFAGGDQAENNRRPFAAGIAAGEKPVLAFMLSFA